MIAFLTCALLALALPWAGLVLIRRRQDLDPFWYGLILLGAGAAVAARIVQMGLWLIYAWLSPLPTTLTAEQLAARPDVLFFAAFLFGPLIEGTKSYSTVLFQTRMNRGNLSLYGLAVGAGAGLLQAFWSLGAVAWTLATTAQPLASSHFWLCLREGLTVAAEATLCALVLWFVARNQRWQAVLGVGAAHGLALLLASQADAPWAGPLVMALLTLAALATLRHLVRKHGWPI